MTPSPTSSLSQPPRLSKFSKIGFALGVIASLGALGWNYFSVPTSAQWSDEERRLIASLSLDQLPPLRADPSNAKADDPSAVALGHALYFDKRLSANGAVACATCHKPELMFTDGLKLAVGSSVGDRHTPSLVGLSYSPWFYWDGRKDSQWSQALAPLEAKHEHATTRSDLALLIKSNANYAALYEAAFGSLPKFEIPANASPLGDDSERAAWQSLSDEEQQSISIIFANIGKALAAYQRKLVPGRARFDDYAERILSDDSAKVSQGGLIKPRRTSRASSLYRQSHVRNVPQRPALY